MGFLQKARVLILGAANDLLDKTIDLNSPSALRQYVRDLESALDKMNSEAAVQAGQVRTLEREIGDMKHNIETETALVQKIMAGTAPNRDAVARQKATNIVNWKKELPEKQAALDAQRVTSNQIDQAVANLETKHTEMVNRVRSLESLDRTTKAKEQAASSLNAAGKLVSSGAGISIDDLEGKMRARGDVAEVKFSRAMGTVAISEDPTTASEVDDLLNTLKAPPAAKAS